MVSPTWDHAFNDRSESMTNFNSGWDRMRFYAFDSCEGIPKPTDIDAITAVFEEGTYACTEHDFWENLCASGVDLAKVKVVKRFFHETLTSFVPQDYGIERASLIHIDSDLYESARLALNFITPALHDGGIIIFDDWFQFHGNPTLGEQRAFYEWQGHHPDWLVTEFQKEGPFRVSFVLNRRH
jgi:O-methyltransferase